MYFSVNSSSLRDTWQGSQNLGTAYEFSTRVDGSVKSNGPLCCHTNPSVNSKHEHPPPPPPQGDPRGFALYCCPVAGIYTWWPSPGAGFLHIHKITFSTVKKYTFTQLAFGSYLHATLLRESTIELFIILDISADIIHQSPCCYVGTTSKIDLSPNWWPLRFSFVAQADNPKIRFCKQ